MLKSNLCDYSVAYILAKETITTANTTVAPAAVNNGDKNVILNNILNNIKYTSNI